CRLGKLAEAQTVAMIARDAFSSEGDLRMQGATRNYLAYIFALRGELDDAAREARIAADITGDVSPEVRVYALATLAGIELIRGRTGDALDCAREAMRMLDAAGIIEEGESLVRLRYAEALEAAGLRDEARAALGAARAHLLARAERI